MSFGIGIIMISFISFPMTYMLFGRNVGSAFKCQFLYWLKSTVLLSIFLFGWSVFKEPEMTIWFGACISLSAASIFNLCRSQASFLIP